MNKIPFYAVENDAMYFLLAEYAPLSADNPAARWDIVTLAKMPRVSKTTFVASQKVLDEADFVETFKVSHPFPGEIQIGPYHFTIVGTTGSVDNLLFSLQMSHCDTTPQDAASLRAEQEKYWNAERVLDRVYDELRQLPLHRRLFLNRKNLSTLLNKSRTEGVLRTP